MSGEQLRHYGQLLRAPARHLQVTGIDDQGYTFNRYNYGVCVG